MTLSQTFRIALIAIAGFLLTAMLHTGPAAQANSPQGVRNIVISSRCVGRWIKLVQSDSTASSQGIACGRRAEPIDLAG